MQILNYQFERDLVREKLETELKFLRNQINPHFLFNTLNSIYALTRKKSDEAPQTVLRLSNLLRFMLYEAKKDQITIQEEINILENYVELEKVRCSNRLTVSFFKEIDKERQGIAPLILLPFVENAFKHGVNDALEETFIDLKLHLENGILIFIVINAKEYTEKKVSKGNLGLQNIHRQLELIYDDFDLTITDLQKTFQISLRINLNEHAKV